MNPFFPNKQQAIEISKGNVGYFITCGIGVLGSGLGALIYTGLAAIFNLEIPVNFIGIVLIIAGILIIFDTFQFWFGYSLPFFVFLFLGSLYFFAGITFVLTIFDPYLSTKLNVISSYFFLLLGACRIIYMLFFILLGLLPNSVFSLQNNGDIMFAALTNLPGKFFWVVCGIINIIFWFLLFKQWVPLTLNILGLFVGFDLVLAGTTRIFSIMFMPNQLDIRRDHPK